MVGGQEQQNKSMSKFFEDLDDRNSIDTKYVQNGNKNKENRNFGKVDKEQQPKIASGSLLVGI